MAYPAPIIDPADIAGTECTSGSGSHVAAVPASVRGDLLIAFASLARPSGSGGTITGSTPAGWTLNNKSSNPFTSFVGIHHRAVYSKIADGSESTVDIATSETDVVGAVQVHRVTRWRGTLADLSVATSATGGPGTSADDAAFDVAWGLKNTLWLSLLFYAKNGALATITPPAGYSNSKTTAQSSGTTRAGVCIAWRENVTTSEDAAPFGLSASNDFQVTSAAIKPDYEVGAGKPRRSIDEVLVDSRTELGEVVLPEVVPEVIGGFTQIPSYQEQPAIVRLGTASPGFLQLTRTYNRKE